MQHDPAPYIIAAAVLGSMIGFFGCALFASRRIKEDTRDAYWEGYYAANRENEAHNDHQHLVPHHLGSGYSPAALITIEDLVPSDPAREDYPVGGIVIVGDADLTHRTTLPVTQ